MNSIINIKLKRATYTPSGIFGILSFKGIPFALTLEREWLNNRPNISCIPLGKYICARRKSPKFGETFEVLDVPNRSHILFHKGNVIGDSYGCILIGAQFGNLWGQPAIKSSGKGFKLFMKKFRGVDLFDLIIA